MSKNNLIKGTAILTLAGFLTRIIGFFYRIYLSNNMTADKIGIYQLIFPIYGICFTIFASGIQTSISTLVAAELGKKNYKNISRIFKMGIALSVSLSVFLSILLYRYADLVAIKVLREAECASSLRILAYAFPFCGITACINGYFYGLKKASIPATTQLLEQIVRVIFVYIAASVIGGGNIKVTTELAVIGLVMGEIASDLFNILSMFTSKHPKEIARLAKTGHIPPTKKRVLTTNLLKITLPLTTNRLLISLLHSLEAILIPFLLKKHGLSDVEALSIYGILNGMTLPFIMFPTAITNSLSVLLLPTISEAQAANNKSLIKKTTALSIKYSLLIGILSMGLFISFGNQLGLAVFHNEFAGSLLVILAWLCPFLYLTTTLSSIINGLGLAHLTFINSVIGLITRILLIIYLIPKNGMKGFLISMLIGQLVITFFDGYVVIKHIRPKFQASELLLKPILIVSLLSYILNKIYTIYMPANTKILPLLFFCFLLVGGYLLLLMLTKTISLKELS